MQKANSINDKMFQNLIHVDNGSVLRKSLPKAKGLTAGFILKYGKSLLGQDLSKIVAPVNINEPCTVL